MLVAELLAKNDALFDALAERAPVGVFVCDASGAAVYVNERLCGLIGVPNETLLGDGWARALHPEDAERVQREWADAAAGGRDFQGEYRFLRPDGGVRWVEGSAAAVRDREGLLLGWVGCCVDLTARKLSDERYRKLFEHASEAIFVLSTEGEVTAINRAGEKLTGYPRDELVGMQLFDLIAPENVERARETFQRRLDGVKNEIAEYQMISKTGTRVFVEVSGRLVEQDGTALGIEAIARDTSERHAFEQKLLYDATHDALTGLPNRTLFHDRLRQALARATRSGSRVAVMLLDLDEFKRVNDSLGHAVGDELLVGLAPRLQRELHGSDSVARLGGDEFAFVFEDITREQDLISMAQRLLAAVADPRDHSQRVTASLGITIAEPSDTAETALSNADTAMYKAKKAGPGGFEVYDETMRKRLLRDLALTEGLATALQDNQLEVHYQPIVSLADGRILALEALARWNHPQWGRIAPSEFIPLAEDRGLIVQLGQFVLSEAAKQATHGATITPTPSHSASSSTSLPANSPSPTSSTSSPTRSNGMASHPPTSASRSPNGPSSTTTSRRWPTPRPTHQTRRTPQPRRLRHRLLLTHSPQGAPSHRCQDRPLLHRRHPTHTLHARQSPEPPSPSAINSVLPSSPKASKPSSKPTS